MFKDERTLSRSPCPCGSGETYEKCCKPFHKGAAPERADLLMRARYSAYALSLPEYIIQTTHPGSPNYVNDRAIWMKKLFDFSKQTVFQKLEVLNIQEHGDLATVTFTAHITQDNEDATYTERSYFERIRGRWFYRNGQLAEGHAPNLITTCQLRPLPLAYYGDPILRKKGEPVGHLTEELRTLVAEMIETMDACNGIGLAAPQVHHSIRLFIIRVPDEGGEDGEIQWGPIKVFINPELSDPSKESWSHAEGCLSIPTIGGSVERPKEITVQYKNLDGVVIRERCKGWEARVIMHENDHINGVLFVDRMKPEARKRIDTQLKQLHHRIHDGTEM